MWDTAGALTVTTTSTASATTVLWTATVIRPRPARTYPIAAGTTERASGEYATTFDATYGDPVYSGRTPRP